MPQRRDYRSGDKPNSIRAIRKRRQGWSANLNDQAAWATPMARDWRSGTGADHGSHSPPLSSQAQGMLNPAWVEALMGYPPGWTDIAGPPDLESRNTPGSRLALPANARTAPPGFKRLVMRSCRRSYTQLRNPFANG